MIKLQYNNGHQWIDCGEFYNENIAWMSLGGDDLNYRTIDLTGKVLTDKSSRKTTSYPSSDSNALPIIDTVIDTAIDYSISSFFDNSSDSSSSDSSSFDGFGGGDFGGGGSSDSW